MIRALVFDFDGLILDTETPEYQAWQTIYHAYGCELPLSDWLRCVGTAHGTFDPYTHLESQLGRPVDRQQIRRARECTFQRLLDAEEILPGVEAVLHAAAELGLALAVASSSPRSWVLPHLTRLALLPTFAAVCCGDEVARTKPDPALYRMAVERLGVAPHEAIALEDSLNGVLAAKAAGLTCVAVPNPITRSLAFDTADLQLNSLAELSLPDLLRRCAARMPGSESGPTP